MPLRLSNEMLPQPDSRYVDMVMSTVKVNKKWLIEKVMPRRNNFGAWTSKVYGDIL
jgi:hypothetical protein